jgi:hypothetical protein
LSTVLTALALLVLGFHCSEFIKPQVACVTTPPGVTFC